jgi:phage gp29-like protein
MFAMTVAADDAAKLGNTLTRDLSKPLEDLNLGARKRYPQIKIGFPDEEDLERFSEAVAPFIARGLPVSQTAILDKFGRSAPFKANSSRI